MTGFVDLDRARLLDVVPGRSGQAVHDWLGRLPADWLAGIGVVALDPFRGYANGLLAHLGHATVVIDHFHAVRLANAAIDDVRGRVQNDTVGHRGRTGDPAVRDPPAPARRPGTARPAELESPDSGTGRRRSPW